jgi:iron complex outermembrane receptor protein
MKLLKARVFKPAIIAAAISASFTTHGLDEGFSIEEVVVTAQKRAQSVADIGVTVTAFGENDIKELGFEKPSDVAAQTPGLSTANATSSGTPIFAIRGIGLDDFNSNNTSGVGVYIDEVLAAYPVFLNGQLFDVERVEVLKGPQGTLYGKNTTGGAINYVSVKPGEEFEGYLSTGLSRWNHVQLEGAVSVPLSDTVSTRLAFVTAQGDGWQKDLDNGREFGDADRSAVRALTRFDLGESAELLLNIHYSKDESTPVSPQNITIDDVFGLPAGVVGISDDDPTKVRAGDLHLSRSEEGYGASATLTVDFDHFSLTSITSMDTYERTVVDNYDGVALSSGDFHFDDEFDVYTQELRLTSSDSDGFHWVGGLVVSYDEVDARTMANAGDLIDGIIGPGVVDNARSLSEYTQSTTSLGAYLHTETDLTEAMTLTVGLRYSQDKREFDGASVDLDGWNALFGGSPAPVPGMTIATLDDSRTERNVSGKVGLDYAIDQDWLIYGNAATSYKAGLFYGSPAGSSEALSYVEPEEVLSYELGFKGAMLDNTMQITGAWYRYEYDDRQSLVIANSPTIPGFIFATLGNITESEISGGELEFRWLPLQQLDIRAGVSYIDSEVSGDVEDIRGLSLAQPIEAGVDLAQAPQWSYNAVVSYELQPVAGYLTKAQLQYSWTDEQFGALADPQAKYGEVENLGLRLMVEPEDGQWQLSAWVDNLENRNATTYSFTSPEGGRVVYRQMPRNYGLELSFHF